MCVCAAGRVFHTTDQNKHRENTAYPFSSLGVNCLPRSLLFNFFLPLSCCPNPFEQDLEIHELRLALASFHAQALSPSPDATKGVACDGREGFFEAQFGDDDDDEDYDGNPEEEDAARAKVRLGTIIFSFQSVMSLLILI